MPFLIWFHILVKTDNATWDLIEVKSSTAVRKEHTQDVAVQRFVIEGAGLPLRQTRLMHINNHYVRNGPIEPQKLFTQADITDVVAPLVRDVPAAVEEFLRVVASKDEPTIDVGSHCNDPYDCEFISHCWQHVPEYSIFDLVRISAKKIALLRDRGILDILDIPDDFALTASEPIQVEVARSGTILFQKDAFAVCVTQLTYPLHFLDFEASTRPFRSTTERDHISRFRFRLQFTFRRTTAGPLSTWIS